MSKLKGDKILKKMQTKRDNKLTEIKFCNGKSNWSKIICNYSTTKYYYLFYSMLDEIRDISRKKLKLFLGTIRKPTTIKIKLNNKNIFFYDKYSFKSKIHRSSKNFG